MSGGSERLATIISWGFGAQKRHELTTCSFQPLEGITIELDVMRTPVGG